MAGSSPHTRGARTVWLFSPLTRRIIPAYAGSTPEGFRLIGGAQDHPRIRGEHDPSSGMSLQQMGSSPHTRGARLLTTPHDGAGGIIPAYAGSTTLNLPPERAAGDHPRIRGEHLGREFGEFSRHGSSPHTRGALGGAAGEADPVGIIPAYAGSTRRELVRVANAKDHPRIRGEHHQIAPIVCSIAGSSPHTRGALVTIPNQVHPQGIIPAYAGSTPHCSTAT